MIPTCPTCGLLHTTKTCAVVRPLRISYRSDHEDSQADFEGEEPTSEAQHFNREWDEARKEDANRIEALTQQVSALEERNLRLVCRLAKARAEVKALRAQPQLRSERQVLVDIQDVD